MQAPFLRFTAIVQQAYRFELWLVRDYRGIRAGQNLLPHSPNVDLYESVKELCTFLRKPHPVLDTIVNLQTPRYFGNRGEVRLGDLIIRELGWDYVEYTVEVLAQVPSINECLLLLAGTEVPIKPKG